MKTFRDFMESSLYAPEGGYYHTRIPTEDFYTAPELHPAFAGILAADIAARFTELAARGVPEPYAIVEMGSGTGLLGLSINRFLKERHPAWASRAITILVERCESQLVPSILRVAQGGAKVMGYSRLEDVPACAGVFLSNELVDAFPVHLLEKKDGLVHEVYVREENAEAVECLGAVSTDEISAYAKAIEPYMQEGERHAINLEASRWMRTVSKVMTAGSLMTIDYGKRFGTQSPNAPRSYYRHAVNNGSLVSRKGQQDLTAPVDFDTLIAEGARCGLTLSYYAPLGKFLIERGIMDWMPKGEDAFDIQAYKSRNRIKTLFHPEGMGETFKVLVQEKLQ
ncbi:MAG: SAM-dependent methyltransferase [Elusimicrobia bacterium]|nr:SAM-dependent methyltransferase [Elusimicrobiota bacterium]